MTPQHSKLMDYIMAATKLANSLKEDIDEGETISDESKRALGQFLEKANEVQTMLDLVEKISYKPGYN